MTGRSSRSFLRMAVVAVGAALALSGCALVTRVVTVGQGEGSIATCTTLQVGPVAAVGPSQADLEATAGVIRSRLDALGVPGAMVEVVGHDLLLLGLPAGDAEAWRAAAVRPGSIAFVPVPPAFDQQVVDGAPLPEGMDATPILTEADIASVAPAADQMGQPAVALTLTSEGAVAFDAFAADNVGQRFAIVVDGVVLSAPVIRESRFGGQAQISGNFTAQEVAALVAAIGSGPLPALVTEVTTTAAVDGACVVEAAVP